MEKKGIEENAIAHTHRLYADMIYGDQPEIDEKGRIRPDSWEMREDVQRDVMEIYKDVTTENFKELTNFARYKRDFMQLNGFEIDGVDYDADIDLEAITKLKP